MKPLVIFGIGEFAEVAHFYFTQDSDFTPVAFTVDREYRRKDHFCELPVVAFEDVVEHFPPSTAYMFVAIGYSGLNRNRAEKFHAAKAMGYRLASYVSSRATVWPGFELAENCFIFEDNTIQPFTAIGADTIMWSGNHLGHHSHVGEHCFLAGHAAVGGLVRIGDFCFIGVHATLRDHITVGDRCIMGMNALILEDAAPDGVYTAEASPRRAIPSYRVKKL